MVIDMPRSTNGTVGSIPTQSGEFADDWHDQPAYSLSPILEASLNAFRENGFHGTSVRDIARRVGVTVPALYYHHENKEAILVALLEPAIDRLHTRCLAALADAGADIEKQFVYLVECLVLHVTDNARLAHLESEIHSLSGPRRTTYVDKQRRVELLLRSVVVSGKDAGLFDVAAPAIATKALLGMIRSVSVWFHHDGSRTGAQLAADFAELAAHTVGAGAAVIDRARLVANARRSP